MNTPLLIPEPPLMVLPTLAQAIGLQKAVILQQVHWLLQSNYGVKLEKDGKRWLFYTYEEWVDTHFPFLSVDIVKKAFLDLEKKSILLSCQPEGKESRRKYYRLNEGAVLNLTFERYHRAKRHIPDGANRHVPTITEIHKDTQRGQIEFSEARNEELARKWFRRGKETQLDIGDLRALKKCRKLKPDEVALLEWWFSIPAEDCLPRFGVGRRRGIASLFNNINAELAKAGEAKRKDSPMSDEDFHKKQAGLL